MAEFMDFTEEAAAYAVSPLVDTRDHILRFMQEHPESAPRAAELYFKDGRDSAVKLRALIEEQRPLDSVRILDFAAGYGRVTRHLPFVIPEAACTACDIHDGAVEFISSLGIEAVHSCPSPDDFYLHRSFDVVFALSFLSHMPKKTWARWLSRLLAHTAYGGLLIFTTHGERSRGRVDPKSDANDHFLFLPHSEQLDLPGTQYGTTLTTFNFVNARVEALGEARFIKFQEGYWWAHQDAYVLMRSAQPRPSALRTWRRRLLARLPGV